MQATKAAEERLRTDQLPRRLGRSEPAAPGDAAG